MMAPPPEDFWADLLSREAQRITAAWSSISAEEQTAVALHLNRMVSEAGWAEVQQASASAALQALHAAGLLA